MVLGGTSLFAVCFLAFAVQSGTALHDVPVVGSLLPDPTEQSEESEAGGSEPQERARPRRSDEEVLGSTLGVLGAWTLPSPYSPDELRGLADELKAKDYELETWENDLEGREKALEEEQALLAERFESLDRLRKGLEEFEARLTLRELEIARDEGAIEERETQRWIQVASVIAELEPGQAAELLSEYEPEDAARILAQLDSAGAAALLAELKNTGQGTRWKEYVDAYSTASARDSK